MQIWPFVCHCWSKTGPSKLIRSQFWPVQHITLLYSAKQLIWYLKGRLPKHEPGPTQLVIPSRDIGRAVYKADTCSKLVSRLAHGRKACHIYQRSAHTKIFCEARKCACNGMHFVSLSCDIICDTSCRKQQEQGLQATRFAAPNLGRGLSVAVRPECSSQTLAGSKVSKKAHITSSLRSHASACMIHGKSRQKPVN